MLGSWAERPHILAAGVSCMHIIRELTNKSTGKWKKSDKKGGGLIVHNYGVWDRRRYSTQQRNTGTYPHRIRREVQKSPQKNSFRHWGCTQWTPGLPRGLEKNSKAVFTCSICTKWFSHAPERARLRADQRQQRDSQETGEVLA